MRVVARDSRAQGEVEVLAELEIALNEGREAACFWLLGRTPVAPVSMAPAVGSPKSIAAELDNAMA